MASLLRHVPLCTLKNKIVYSDDISRALEFKSLPVSTTTDRVPLGIAPTAGEYSLTLEESISYARRGVTRYLYKK